MIGKKKFKKSISAISGWGWKVFSSYSHWWLVPIFACHLGGVLGAIIYWIVLHNDSKIEDDWNDDNEIVREVTVAQLLKSKNHSYKNLHVRF